MDLKSVGQAGEHKGRAIPDEPSGRGVEDRTTPAPLHARLVVEVGRAKGQAVEIQVPRFYIGRDPRCHLRPNSPAVSRLHALIEQRDGRVFVRDLGTKNGTVLNDRMVHGEELEASNGDRLQIGPLVFTLVIEARTGPHARTVEDEAAKWLLEEGGDADALTVTMLQPPPAGIPARGAASSRPPASAAGGAIRVRHLRHEVVQGVLVITVLTPSLNDETTVGPVRYELSSLFAQPLPRRVVVNLELVTYLSSRAVGVLLAHFQKLSRVGGMMRLCYVHPQVMTVLDQMRLPMLIEIFPTVDEAVLTAWDGRE